MYAVIETGGKQYRVELGSELAVERLDGGHGDTISFERVLLVADGDEATVGRPTVADALVTASVVRQDRGAKVTVFKYRPKARHRAKHGHRQEQTVVRVSDIRYNGRSAADEANAQQREDSRARKAAAAEAERRAAADQELAAKLEQEAAQRTAKAKAASEEAAESKSARAKSATTRKPTKTGADKTAAAAKPTANAAPSTKATGPTRASTAKTQSSKAAADKPDKSTKPQARPSRTKKDE
jgi:large subunit ribosomal protein L21